MRTESPVAGGKDLVPAILQDCPDPSVVCHKVTDTVGSPFALIGLYQKNEALETIAEFLQRSGWDYKFILPTICVVNGMPVKRGVWHLRLIQPTDIVEFWSRPGNPGGGSSSSSSSSSAKNLIPVIALVAATVLVPYIAGPIAGAIGVSLTTVKAGFALLMAAGSLLLSHFNKPKASAQSQTDDTIYSITSSANAARPLQPIPVGYGRRINYPDLAAPAWTEYNGNDEYLYELFCIGIGKYQIHEVRIDDTPLWDEVNGQSSTFANVAMQFYGPGEQITLFPLNVVTASEVSGMQLGDTDFRGGFIVNAAGTQANQIILDLVWPSGSYTTYKDKIYGPETGIEVQYQAVDDAGAPTSGWSTLLNKAYTFAKQSPIRITEKIDVAPGRYSIRLRRTNDPIAGQKFGAQGQITGTDDVQWEALRANIEGPNIFPDVTMMAIRTVAGKEVSSVTSRRFGVVQTRILPVWDSNTGEWVEAATRNPIWAVVDAWTNDVYSAGLDLEQCDLTTMINLAAAYDAAGYTFDHFFTQPVTVYAALETILKAARSHPAFIGDKLTVVFDADRGLPRMMLTDREVRRGTLTVTRNFLDEEFADGVIVDYLDQTSWRAADVASSQDLTAPARIQVDGVVSRQQAFELACYYAAQNQYRRKTVSLQVELEGRMLKRGDCVLVQSSLPRTWGTVTTPTSYDPDAALMTVSRDLPWGDYLNGTFWVEIRRKDGRPFGPIRVHRGANDHEVAFDTDDLAQVEQDQVITIEDVLDRENGQEEPSIAFSSGTTAKTFRGLVTQGRVDGNYMTLDLVVDDLRVYDAAGGLEVPPIIPTPLTEVGGLPRIDRLGVNVYQRQANIVLQAGWGPVRSAVSYIAQASYDQGASWTEVYTGRSTSFEAIIWPGQTVRVRVACVTASGALGAWVSSEDQNVPDILVDNSQFFIQLNREDFEPLESRQLMGFQLMQLMQPMSLVAANTRVVAYQANENANAAYEHAEDVRVTDEEARAVLQDTITANYTTADANLSSTLTNQISVVSNAQQTTAQNLTTLTSTVNSNKASADQGIQTNATAISANSVALTSLTSTVGANKATADQQYQANVDANAATAASLTSLATTVSNNKATADQQFTTNSTAITANANAITSLSSTVNNNKATADQNYQTNANANAATAQSVTSLSSTVNSNKASADASFLTYANKFGELQSQYVLTLDNNGYIAGMWFVNSLGSSGSSASSLTFRTDKFLIGYPGYTSAQFSVVTTPSGARVGIDGSLMANGSVQAGSISTPSLSALSANLGSTTQGQADFGNLKIYSGGTYGGGGPRIEVWG